MKEQPIYEAILPNWQERRLLSANSVIVRLCFCVQLTAEFSLHESCRFQREKVDEKNGLTGTLLTRVLKVYVLF